MQGHATGPIQGGRIGADSVVQTFQIDRTNNVTAANNKLMTIKASPTQPVFYRTSVVIGVAETTTGAATLSLGTASAGTQILNAVNLKTAAGGNLVPTNPISVAIADTDIWALVARADGAGVTGVAYLAIELWDAKVTAPSTVE